MMMEIMEQIQIPVKPNVFVQYIQERTLKKNKSFMMVVVGPTGSGKSYAIMKLAQQVDLTFTIDRLCFSALEFMKCINDLIELSKQGVDIRNRVVIWDEMGVGNSARTFMSMSNKVISYFFQTCRHLNLVILMSVPNLAFIDANSRKMIHAVGEMKGINTHNQTSSVKVLMSQVNATSGKLYLKYLRYIKDKKQCKMKRVKFHLPSQDLLNAYEFKKKAFTTQLNIEIMNKLQKVQDKENDVRPNPNLKPITQLQEGILNCLREGITKHKDIGLKLGKKREQITENIKFLRNKGYSIGKRIL